MRVKFTNKRTGEVKSFQRAILVTLSWDGKDDDYIRVWRIMERNGKQTILKCSMWSFEFAEE